MKSRMKKLLAAALALCLIAAMVPGAALAADTVATIPNGDPKEFSDLSNAFAKAQENTIAENKVVTLTADYTISSSLSLPRGVTLFVPAERTLTVSNGASFTVSGTLNLEGNLNIAIGASVSAQYGDGELVNNGEITLAGSTATGNIATMTVNGGYSGRGSIDVGARATVSLPSNTEIGGSLTVAAGATVTSSGTLTITGTADISSGGKLNATAIEIDSSGRLDNSGEIGAVTVDTRATLTMSDSAATVGSMTVYGTLAFESDFSVGSVSGDGLINVSSGCEVTLPSNYSFSGKIDVADGATLNVGQSEKVGSATIDGDAVLSKEGTTTVITVGDATVNGNVSVGSSEKMVVNGTLTVANNLTVEGALQINSAGTVNINSNHSMTVESAMSGSGHIYVSGVLYNQNNSNADSVKIQIVGGGYVYSQSAALGDNIQNGRVTSGTSTYPNVWQLGEGSSYNITVRPGSHGNVSNPPASGTSGTQVTITATPADGYVVDQSNTYYMIGSTRYDLITVSGDNCSFLMPQNDVTVFINFTEEEQESETVTQGNITVVTNHNGNGTVNASINGRTITITATASNNYYVKSIRFDSDTRTSTGNPATFKQSYTVSGTGNATVNVYVTFESDKFTVTATNSSSRDGDVYVGTSGYANSGEFQEGKRVYIHAVPDSRDYALRTLYVYNTTTSKYIDYYEASGYDDVYYFTMPESNVTVWGYFTDGIYEITKDIDGNGSLTITGEDGNVTDVAEEGEEIRITASANNNNNYRLGDLYVTYTDSDDEDQVIYPEVEYKNNGNVDYYWFEMPEYDVEIYADFGEGDYVAWIDRSDMKNGTIRVSPNVADEDDTVSIYVTPDTGYQLDELIVEDEDGHDVTTSSLASGTRYTFRMPDSDVTVTATFKSRSYSSNFTDVPRYEWYYEAVSYVASEGLMNGVSTTQFNPNGTASRAQIVTILWRLAGEPSALTGAFTDVPAGQYYSTAVAWASRQGIVTGVGNNRFEPNSNITREQLAVILYRYAQDAGYTTSASANITGYYDYARVNSYARTAMSWAVGAGLITGTSTTTLSPQDTATRAQVATILMRFCENIAK